MKSQASKQAKFGRYYVLLRALLATFLFSLTCIIFFLWITFENMRFFAIENKETHEALQSMKHLETILDDMQDLEIGERGFTITKQKDFLKPVLYSVSDIDKQINGLYSGSGFDKKDLQSVQRLEKLVREKIFVSKSVIAAIDNSTSNKSFIIEKSNEAKKLMDEIRILILQLEERGRLILNKSRIEQEQKAKHTAELFLFTSVVVILIMTLAFLYIRKNLNARLKTEIELVKATDRLSKLSLGLEEEVQQKTTEISRIFERVSDAFIALDKTWKYIYVNEIAALQTGFRRRELIGQNIWDILPEKYRDPFLPLYVRAMQSKFPLHEEVFVHSTNQWFSKHFYPSEDGLSVFFQDITYRKEQENILAESARKYRLLFENNPMPMWVFDVKSLQILDVNDAAIHHYGYSKDEFLSMSILNLRQEDEKDKLVSLLRKSALPTINTGDWVHRKKDGTIINVRIYSHNLQFDHHDARLVLADDISDKLKAEFELRESHEELRQLSNYLNEIREIERTTIAREIHDELGQQMTGLKMDVSWIRKKVNGNDEALQERIQGMLNLIDETVKTIRRIATELRPGILDDLGLEAAIEWQANEFEKRTGIKSAFESNLAEVELSKNIATGFFRVFQESLTNVARHAKADKVEIDLRKINNNLKLRIKDNGVGFYRRNGEKTHTLGLLGMQERAKMLGGNLKIESAPGNGTTVEITAPINKD